MLLKNDKSRFLQHSEPSWEKEKRDRPFNNNRTFIFCYTKCHVTEFSTSSDSRECIFDSLFPHESILSERIYFVLVSTKSKEGDQKTNPFRFIRKCDLLKEKAPTSWAKLGKCFAINHIILLRQKLYLLLHKVKALNKKVVQNQPQKILFTSKFWRILFSRELPNSFDDKEMEIGHNRCQIWQSAFWQYHIKDEELTTELFHAAKKYRIEELFAKCKEKLIETISVENTTLQYSSKNAFHRCLIRSEQLLEKLFASDQFYKLKL